MLERREDKMAEENFYNAVEAAKRIEREMLSYLPFEGKIEVMKTLEFYPKEYTNLNFHDLLNHYDRIDKVIKTSKLGIYSAEDSAGGSEIRAEQDKVERPAEVAKKEEIRAKTEEVENKVKEITSTSIENAENIKSAESIEKIEEKMKAEKPVESKDIDFGSLEFEKHGFGKKEERLEERKKESQVMITHLDRKEKIHETKEMIPAEEKEFDAVGPTLPSALEESAKEAASVKYQEIEDHLKREWEGELDEQRIKKKMLDLTKELLKEKSVNAREKIKGEIVALKSMLSKITTKKKRGTETAATGYSPTLFESLIGTQTIEVTTEKESLVLNVRKRIEEIKKRFYDKLTVIGEDGKREEKKANYEQFVFDLTALTEKLNNELAKQEGFITQKHVSETEQFVSNLPKEEKKLAEKAQDRISSLKQLYQKEFGSIRNILTKDIETIIDQAGHAIFKEEGEALKKEDPSQILFDINETDEATLLYYLHSKDSDVYKRYERKHLSKHEAIHHAKILMAKEKGLSEDIITKYFGQFEQAEEEKR